MLPLNITTVKYAAIIFLIIAVVGVGYNTAYNHGKLSGEAECIAETDKLIKQIHDRISQVEKNLDEIADLATTQQDKLSKDIQEILKKVKSKPIVIIKNGKCIPSTNFVDGINEAIRRANQK